MSDLLDDLDQYATALEKAAPTTPTVNVDRGTSVTGPGRSKQRSRIAWLAAAAALVGVAVIGIALAAGSPPEETDAANASPETAASPNTTSIEQGINEFLEEIELTNRAPIHNPFSPEEGIVGYADHELATELDPETGVPIHPVLPAYSYEDGSEIGYFYVGFGFVDPAIADAPGFDINEYIGYDINQPFREQFENTKALNSG